MYKYCILINVKLYHRNFLKSKSIIASDPPWLRLYFLRIPISRLCASKSQNNVPPNFSQCATNLGGKRKYNLSIFMGCFVMYIY